MNIKTIKRPSERIDVRYLSTLKIKSYGDNNLYPNTLIDVVRSSATGTSCLNRYASFIEGNGFKDLSFAKYIVNRYGDTADDIASAVAYDLAAYGGFAIHVNHNVFGEAVEIQHVPFESCRLKEEDDSGYVGFIVTHPDWKGKRTRNGKTVKVNPQTIKEFFIYNPDKRVIQGQIQRDGGIEFYQGQIMWRSTAGRLNYPIPKYDAVIPDMSTDEGLANVRYRNVRNNFLPSGMLVSHRSQMYDSNGSPMIDEYGNPIMDDSGYADELLEFQGDEKSLNIMSVTVNNEEETPKFVEFPVRNFDKDFAVTDAAVVERIYSAFDQDVFHTIKIGKLGFSGDVIRDAYDYYSSITDKERRMIERAFESIFIHWFEVANPSGDYSIQPLKFISNESVVTT